MFDHLDIYDPRERWLIGAADLGLGALSLPFRLMPRRAAPPRRILLLRLERIGDLLMSLGAIAAVRRLAPEAEIDLVVGRWNAEIAQLLPSVNQVHIVDAPWLARGEPGSDFGTLWRHAHGWRHRQYDLAINFEGDIRSHGLMALSRARRRVGFGMAGGGPLLTDVVAHDASRHVAANNLALVERAFDLGPGTLPAPPAPEALTESRLPLPERTVASARAALAHLAGGTLPARLIALHAAGGRQIKQWAPDRFAEAGGRLARDLGAAVVLTGGPDDAAIVGGVEASLKQAGVTTVRVQGTVDLVKLAGVLRNCQLLLTGDTGPMHLAAAVGTPVVAVFGPSMPWRYAPLVAEHRIVRVDLPCSPCNRIRRPPERCVGHVPDCLEGVSVDAVVAAARSLAATLALTPLSVR
jgi:lipopolysaccharide heptosyltransferase II